MALVKRLVSVDPSQRPSADELLTIVNGTWNVPANLQQQAVIAKPPPELHLGARFNSVDNIYFQ